MSIPVFHFFKGYVLTIYTTSITLYNRLVLNSYKCYVWGMCLSVYPINPLVPWRLGFGKEVWHASSNKTKHANRGFLKGCEDIILLVYAHAKKYPYQNNLGNFYSMDEKLVWRLYLPQIIYNTQQILSKVSHGNHTETIQITLTKTCYSNYSNVYKSKDTSWFSLYCAALL